jgi:hypothetical protein
LHHHHNLKGTMRAIINPFTHSITWLRSLRSFRSPNYGYLFWIASVLERRSRRQQDTNYVWITCTTPLSISLFSYVHDPVAPEFCIPVWDLGQ